MKLNKSAAVPILLLVIFVLSGCASLTNPSRVHELDGQNSYALDVDASRRAILIVRKDQNLGICAEPAPDVSVEFVSKILAEVNLPDSGIDAKTQAELQSRAIELSGRTQVVLFLRESLYRLCEQGLNGNLEPEQVKELYQIALNTALMLAEKDLLEERRQIIQDLEDPRLKQLFEGVLPSSSKLN